MLRACLMAERQTPLVRRANAGQTPRHDLAALGHELREQADVLVVDGFNLLDAELANLLAAEILASAFAAAARAAGTRRTPSPRSPITNGPIARRKDDRRPPDAPSLLLLLLWFRQP